MVPAEEAPEPSFNVEDLPALTPIALEMAPNTYYFRQAGAYQELAAAEAAVKALMMTAPNLAAIISDEVVNGQTVHRVLAGRFTDRIEAVLTRSRLQAEGLAANVRQMVLAEG
jgi:rare lipoprotein A